MAKLAGAKPQDCNYGYYWVNSKQGSVVLPDIGYSGQTAADWETQTKIEETIDKYGGDGPRVCRFIYFYHLSYIYLGSSVCLSSCHIPSCRPVIFLSSCHICGTLSYSLRFGNQTDQGDETEGLEREGLRWRDRKGTDCRGRVWIDFSLIKPY
jgi:hypothetical protein